MQPGVPASQADGSSEREAQNRRAQYGPNEARPASQGGPVAALLLLFTDPLVVILLLAVGVSGFLWDIVGAAIIWTMAILSITLSFVMSHRSRRADDRLREEIAPMAAGCRDGRWQERPRHDLVPGDLGFVLPPAFFMFLVAATVAYLLLVEMTKRRFMRFDDDVSHA